MIGRALFAALDGALAVLEAGARTYDRGRRILRAVLPKRREEEPIPLTQRAVNHQQEQIRRATTVRLAPRDSTILPPKG